jgi:hypothetical protein
MAYPITLELAYASNLWTEDNNFLAGLRANDSVRTTIQSTRTPNQQIMENQNPVSPEVLDALAGALKKAFDERQEKPDQYVVAYKNQKTDETLGYHADTFCTMTKEILEGKRYNGEDPYPQLAIIAKNLRYAMQRPQYVEQYMPGLTADDVYIDAIYLAEGTPKQNFHFKIVSNG